MVLGKMDLFSLVFLMGFALTFVRPHFNNRRIILLLHAMSCIFYIIYLYGGESYAGIVICVVAMTSSLIQASIAEENLSETFMFRTFAAIIFTIAGVVFCYQGSGDLFAIMAFVIARFGEAQISPQRIRVSLLFSNICWGSYAFTQGLYLMFFSQFIIFGSIAFAVLKYKRLNKKAVAVTARTY
jgi:hypothetical protein